MELYAAVQPLVMTREAYQIVYGEDDPEELAIMLLQDREAARQIGSVLNDLYFLDVDYSEPLEGEGLAEEVGTTDDLHALRRIAAALNDKTPDDYHEGRVPAGFIFNHLINHSDVDGYYVPVPFPQAFFLEETSIGSSVALLAELDALEAPLAAQFPAEVALAITTGDDEERAPLVGPVGVWHSLRRLCQSSIALGMPIQFG
jgi:hypothetical protein